MTPRKAKSNTEWLADLRSEKSQTEALADLREYLLCAVFLYLERYREDLSDLGQRDLEQLAQDFTQEALLQILDSLDTFRGESKFTTWAYRFVINVAGSELRLHRWRTLSVEMVIGEQTPLSAFLGDQRAPDPETMAVRNHIIELIHQIIDEELTDRQRFALVSVYFKGVSMTEVARQLDATRNSVYKLIHDARKKLKRRLQRRYYSKADVLAIFGQRQNW